MDNERIRVLIERKNTRIPILKIVLISKNTPDELRYLLLLTLNMLEIAKFYEANIVIDNNSNEMYGKCNNNSIAVAVSLSFISDSCCNDFREDVAQFLMGLL